MSSRVERIEQSLAEIVAAQKLQVEAQQRTSVALEKLAGLEASRKYCEDAINDHESRIRSVEIRMPLHQQTTDWAGRIVTGLLAAVGMAVLATVLK